MKICFITGSIFSLGGIQRVLSVIASELSKNSEYNIEILCTSDKYIEDRSIYNLSKSVKVTINPYLEKNNFKGKIIKKFNSYTGLLDNSRYEKLLINSIYLSDVRENFIKYINENEYDIVIGVADYYSLLLGVIKQDIRSKAIGWQHNSYDAYLNTKYRYCWNLNHIFNKYIKKLDRYIVLNNYDKNKYKKKMGIECDVIYNPKSFESEIKSKCDKKQFLAAGRLTYQKGFDMLIESFNLFAKENKEWNLVIVGEGEEENKIKNLIKKYNLEDRIRIDKFTSDIKSYFLNSSVLLLPSRWEGMPMIVLESLEMGVPVISYDITAIEPIIDDKKQGLIVEKYDINMFTNAMQRIVSDEKLLSTYSKSAVEKSNEFKIENIINKWNYFIDNV